MTGAQQEQGIDEVTTQQALMLRALHGAPLTVLVALHLFGPMSRRAMCRRTGYKRRAVEEALHVLEEVGLVQRVHYREWRLTPDRKSVSLVASRIKVVMACEPAAPGSDGVTPDLPAEMWLPDCVEKNGSGVPPRFPVAAAAQDAIEPEVAPEDTSAAATVMGSAPEMAWEDTSVEVNAIRSDPEVALEDTSAAATVMGSAPEMAWEDTSVEVNAIRSDPEVAFEDTSAGAMAMGSDSEVALEDTSAAEMAFSATSPFDHDHDHGSSFDHDHVTCQQIINDDQHHDHDQHERSWSDEEVAYGSGEAPFAGDYDDAMLPRAAEEDGAVYDDDVAGTGAAWEAVPGEYAAVAPGEAEEAEALLAALQALDPPFAHAAAWLEEVPLPLVRTWLDYLEAMPWAQRELLHNEAAFLRSRVEQGRPPPAPRQRKRTRAANEGQRRACPRCGKRYRNRRGECLYCAGLIQL
jgi:hypothetical protein